MRLIGASLTKHHIDHDNGPCAGNNNCGYVYLYHLSHICRTLVPEIHVHHEMLHVFRYIDVVHVLLINVVVIVMTSEQQRPELLTVCREDCRQTQVAKCTDTW